MLQDYQLLFYLDHKVAKEVPGAKPQATFPLLQATVCPYSKEKKAKHVFQVSQGVGLGWGWGEESLAVIHDSCIIIYGGCATQ